MATVTLYLKSCDFSAWCNGGEDYATMSSTRNLKGQFAGAGLDLSSNQITAIGIYGDYRRNTTYIYPMGNTNRGATLYNGSSISSIGSAVSSQEDGDSKMSNNYAGFTNYYTTDANIINSLVNQINSGLVVTIDLYADNKGSSSGYRIYGKNIRLVVTFEPLLTVTLNPNGGTVSPTTLSYASGATYGTLPTPTRNGYKFLYWTKEDGTRIYLSTTISSSHTLVAKWKAVGTFYVYFSGYGATSGTNSAPSAITATYGQSYTLPSPNTATFYKRANITWDGNADDAILNYTERNPNCTFIGWKRDPNTSTLYQPGESVNIEPTTEGGNVTFYATWQPATCEHPSATREGYKLKEWNTKADGSGTAYTGASISTLEDITLYAQWEEAKPKIKNVQMIYLDKQISETNKVPCGEGFVISVELS